MYVFSGLRLGVKDWMGILQSTHSTFLITKVRAWTLTPLKGSFKPG